MLKIDRQKVAKNKLPIGLLSIEIAIAIITVYLFYKTIGFSFSLKNKAITFTPNPEPILLFFFALSIALLVAVHLTIKKRFPTLFKAQQQAPKTIKEKTKEKLSLAKSDPRAAALLLVEFLFVFAVVLTIVAWLDPELELIPWERIGVFDPMKTILNAILAIIGLAFFYYLYSFTAWYRK